MEYRNLGGSGVKVSEISLGSWLTYGAGVEAERATRTIHKAYELGVNFFDTANVYAQGEAEKIVGKALANFPRSSYVLATKVFGRMGDGVNDQGLSRKHIMEQCEASLKRLGHDYIDLYYCHRFDPSTPVEETLRALNDLVTQGKVLYIGISEWAANRIVDGVRVTEALNFNPIIVNQPLYNMLERDLEDEVMPLCARENIGIVPFSPLAQGVLTGKYQPGGDLPGDSRAADDKVNRPIQRYMNDDVLERVQQLKPIASDYGLSLAQFAVAWILRRDEVSSALVGASRPSQIEENVGASGVTISDTDLEEVDRILGYVEEE